MYSKLKGAHQTRHSFQKVIKERKEKKRKEKAGSLRDIHPFIRPHHFVHPIANATPFS
jgi:hypothetical protein